MPAETVIAELATKLVPALGEQLAKLFNKSKENDEVKVSEAKKALETALREKLAPYKKEVANLERVREAFTLARQMTSYSGPIVALTEPSFLASLRAAGSELSQQHVARLFRQQYEGLKGTGQDWGKLSAQGIDPDLRTYLTTHIDALKKALVDMAAQLQDPFPVAGLTTHAAGQQMTGTALDVTFKGMAMINDEARKIQDAVEAISRTIDVRIAAYAADLAALPS